MHASTAFVFIVFQSNNRLLHQASNSTKMQRKISQYLSLIHKSSDEDVFSFHKGPFTKSKLSVIFLAKNTDSILYLLTDDVPEKNPRTNFVKDSA
jgi:hypothetical protein